MTPSEQKMSALPVRLDQLRRAIEEKLKDETAVRMWVYGEETLRDRLVEADFSEPFADLASAAPRLLTDALQLLGSVQVKNETLDDIASDLFSELCEGDGEHSEALDRALILKHLKRAAQLSAADARAEEKEPLCECGSRADEHGVDGIWHTYRPVKSTDAGAEDAHREQERTPVASSPYYGPSRTCRGCQGYEGQHFHGCVVPEFEAQLTAALQEQERLKKENDSLRTRAIVAEQHKTLSLLGKSSWQEVVEDKLRTELAETQIRAEDAAAQITALQTQLDEVRVVIENEIAGQQAYADSTAPSAGLTRPGEHRHTAGVLRVMLRLLEFKKLLTAPARQETRQESPQDSLLHPAHQVYFRAGLIACREYMARFVETQSPEIANSIRANWWPSLGQDFGPPRKLEFGEVTAGEYGTPEFRTKTADEVSPTQEALPIALVFLNGGETRQDEGRKEALVAGSWPRVCVQRAFVDGAAWWLWKTKGFTPWASERDEMEDEAVKRYGEPRGETLGAQKDEPR